MSKSLLLLHGNNKNIFLNLKTLQKSGDKVPKRSLNESIWLHVYLRILTYWTRMWPWKLAQASNKPRIRANSGVSE